MSSQYAANGRRLYSKFSARTNLMEESINHDAVILQLQLENEMLRNSMRTFSEVREAVYAVPNLFEQLWHKAMANKYQLLVGLMIVYWAVTIAFMLYDRMVK